MREIVRDTAQYDLHDAAMKGTSGAAQGDELDFARIAAVSPTGMVILDPAGFVRYANAAAARILGHSTQSALGKDARSLSAAWGLRVIPAKDTPPLPLATVQRTLRPVRGVILAESTSEGGEQQYRMDCIPVVEDGVLSHILLTFADAPVTSPVGVAVAAEYTQLHHVLAHVPIATCVITETGEIELANAAFAALFSREVDVLIGMPFLPFLPAEVAGQVLARLQQPDAAATETVHQIGATGASDAPLHLQISSIPFTGADGKLRLAVFLQDLTTQAHAEERLTRLALYDGLTGLPNRVLFGDRLSQTLRHARQSWQMAAVLFLDFDGFKRVNDTYGHDAGDTVLRILAQRLRASVPENDDIARRGGDEFLVLMPTLGVPEDAAILSRKIIGICGEPMTVKGRRVQMGVSVGIAIFPFDGQDAEGIIAAADRAMYVAKRRGKGMYVFAQREGNS